MWWTYIKLKVLLQTYQCNYLIHHYHPNNNSHINNYITYLTAGCISLKCKHVLKCWVLDATFDSHVIGPKLNRVEPQTLESQDLIPGSRFWTLTPLGDMCTAQALIRQLSWLLARWVNIQPNALHSGLCVCFINCLHLQLGSLVEAAVTS